MALEVLNNCDCCNVEFLELTDIQDCLDGFIVSGLTPETVYSIGLKTSSMIYVRQFTTDIAGVLTIEATAFPDRLLNRWGGYYELEVSGVTFGPELYTGFKFKISDNPATGYYSITQTPNE